MTDSDLQTEDKIFEAATDVFVEKGMDGARMQDIANHAGINKSLLHYYYRSKDHLFNAVFEKIADKMFSKFAPVFDEHLSLEDKIRFFYREQISFLQKNPRLPAFLLNEINRNPGRIKKLIRNINVNRFVMMLFEQHGKELAEYGVTEKLIPQMMTTIAAISVFPFAARGILETLFEKVNINFDEYLEERKTFAPEFVIRSLKAGGGFKNT